MPPVNTAVKAYCEVMHVEMPDKKTMANIAKVWKEKMAEFKKSSRQKK